MSLADSLTTREYKSGPKWTPERQTIRSFPPLGTRKLCVLCCSKMKCLVLAVALLAVGTHAFFTPAQVEFAKNLSTTCEAEVGDGLPENIGERFRMGDLTLEDDKSKCYMRCIFGKVGFLDTETGAINKQTLAQKLAKGSSLEKSERFAERCGSFEGANACEKAHGLYKCYFNNKDEYFA